MMSTHKGKQERTSGGQPTRCAEFHRGTLRGWPRAAVRWLILFGLRPFMRLTIAGLEHVPERSAFLLIANHLHNADPILIEAAITRPVHFMAKLELFRNRLVSLGARFVGAFPVDRGRPDRTAIRRAESLLGCGIAVGMFPEGTRSVSGRLQPGFPGAALIALRGRVPVLPVTITGTETLPFNGRKSSRQERARQARLRRRHIAIQFGVPFWLPTERDGRRVTAAMATEVMMAEIGRMLPESYRGHAEASQPSLPPVGAAEASDDSSPA